MVTAQSMRLSTKKATMMRASSLEGTACVCLANKGGMLRFARTGRRIRNAKAGGSTENLDPRLKTVARPMMMPQKM